MRRVQVGFVLLLLLAGCGGPRLGKVSGRVTVGGQLVTEGVILFHPESGPAAVGAIRPDGTYELTTLKPGDGAVVGTHRVAIQATRVSPGHLADAKTIDEEIARSGKSVPGGKVLVAGTVTWVVPERYAQVETSGLTRKVESGTNTFHFDLSK